MDKTKLKYFIDGHEVDRKEFAIRFMAMNFIDDKIPIRRGRWIAIDSTVFEIRRIENESTCY